MFLLKKKSFGFRNLGRGPNAFDFCSQRKLLVARDTYSSRSVDFRAVLRHQVTLPNPQNPREVPTISTQKSNQPIYWLKHRHCNTGILIQCILVIQYTVSQSQLSGLVNLEHLAWVLGVGQDHLVRENCPKINRSRRVGVPSYPQLSLRRKIESVLAASQISKTE